jgi:hypothetical protein
MLDPAFPFQKRFSRAPKTFFHQTENFSGESPALDIYAGIQTNRCSAVRQA